tara:strand:- start:1761 stop:2321 length:561 start_codon:yes stop_codon:yes gene_type:complete
MMYLKMNQIEDDKLTELLDVYKEVADYYGRENCFLKGSMAIYFMCKMLNIDVGDDFEPNDVDIAIYTNKYPNVRVRGRSPKNVIENIGRYNYDLFAHPNTVTKYHYIDVMIPNEEPQRIYILHVNEILRHYKYDLAEGKPNAQTKIKLLNQIIQVYDENKENNSFILKTVKIESERKFREGKTLRF